MTKMPMVERHKHLLICPHDFLDLTTHEGTLACSTCGRKYPIESGIIHFVTREEERPQNSKTLAQLYAEELPERLDVDYYQHQYAQKEDAYMTNAAVKEAVDFVVANIGVGVDLATGPGGGYIGPIVKRLSKGATLFASDACLPVIENWSRCLQSEYANRFAFLDIDLNGNLCFPDNSIDVFSGVEIANVNDGNPTGLLQEVHRCLKPDGWAVFQEIFFAPGSETATLLSQEDDFYASVSVFSKRTLAMGLQVTRTEQVKMGVGKISLGDGMPINDRDRWCQKILYLQKK